MQTLDAPVARTPDHMPLLRSGADRCALRAGTNTLGGRGPDAVPVPALAWQPAVAIITVPPSGPPTLQRVTAAVVVRLNDEPIGIGPVELRHGAHIDFSGIRLTFDAESAAADVTIAGNPTDAELPTGAHERWTRPAEMQGARLVNLRSGKRYLLPERKIVIGRDESCDLVVHGDGVSRRHASVMPAPGGYLLSDESSNGTLVNGERVAGTHILEKGDVISLSGEELRFETAAPVGEAAPTSEHPSRAATAVLDVSRLRGELSAEELRAAQRPSPTAKLEIVRGPFTGATFHIARPVCAIGRSEGSDIRLRDESVSGSHATLLRKGDTWYVVDLRSVNGTFVNGSRVAGEREISTGAMLRIGRVEMLFTSFSDGVADVLPTRHRGSLLNRFLELFRKAVPSNRTF